MYPSTYKNNGPSTRKERRYRKKRLTHYQSFPRLASKESINDLFVPDTLEPLIYGYMFMRVIHMIYAMRFVHPHIIILIY